MHVSGVESILRALRKKSRKPHHKHQWQVPGQEKQTETGSHSKSERSKSSSRMRIGGPALSPGLPDRSAGVWSTPVGQVQTQVGGRNVISVAIHMLFHQVKFLLILVLYRA